ncbi:spindlin-W [Microcaecilia unicolor]|uniref:Spindlin-W-like n=1 Tax=Microcaecilia unicolor TaxID=1415580 RepID=A0A6P7ZD34_9AMPH|nr:spindlin-W-like [Microcaecilia unicolor]
MSQRKLRKQSSEELEHPRTSQWPPLLTGETIQHGWQENSKKISQWRGLVLDQMEVNLSLYLVKYDGFDCVYGIELFKDKRVKKLRILPKRSVLRTNEDTEAAEALVGKAVTHTFEKEDGRKNKWRGLVLCCAPIMTSWHYITYEKDPILYMYPLLQDQRDGDLQIIPESENKHLVPPGQEPGAIEAEDSLVGKPVEYVTEKGVKKTGMFIYRVSARPSVYFVKFNNDFYIYVYDLVKAV